MNQIANRLCKKFWSLLLLATFGFSILSPTADARLIFSTEDDGVESDVYTLDVDGTVNLTDNTDLSLNFGANLGASITYNDSTGEFTFNKDVDLGGNELKDVIIERSAGDPVACTAGDDGRVYYNTTSDQLFVCDGDDTTWNSTDTSGLASANIFVGNAGGVATGVALSGDATLDNTGALTLADGSVDGGVGGVITDGSITAADLGTGSVGSDELADGSVNGGVGGDITDGSITAADLGTDSVAADELADDAVDAAAIDSAGAGNSKILTTDGAGATAWVDQTDFTSSSLTSAQIYVGNGAGVATGVAASGDVTLDNTGAFTLAAGSVDGGVGGVITDGSITTADLGTDSVASDELADDAVDTAAIQDNAVDGSKLGIGTTAGDTLYYDGTDWVRLAIGTAGQKLVTNATTDGTEWVDDNSLDDSLASANLYVGNGSGVATGVALSGDATIDNTGAFTLADGSVSGGVGGVITDGSITTADLGTDSVDTDEIAADAVGDSEIDYSAVTLSDFTNDLGLASANLFVGNGSGVATGVALSGDATIDNAGALTLAAGSVDGGVGGVITDGSITTADLGTDSVASDELADDAVDTAAIQDNAVDGSKLGIGTTAGDTMYYDGTDWVRLGVGTAGQILATNATTDATEWIDNTSTPIDVSVAMPPEFPNFTITADGTNNRGTLESDYDSGNNRNYYQWTTRRGAMQDYDLVVQWPIPEDFDDWQSAPISFDYRTNDGVTTNNQLDLVSILDTAGTSIALAGDTTDLANASWTQADVTGVDSAGVYTAGEFITITFKLQSTSGDFAQLGAMQFNYSAK